MQSKNLVYFFIYYIFFKEVKSRNEHILTQMCKVASWGKELWCFQMLIKRKCCLICMKVHKYTNLHFVSDNVTLSDKLACVALNGIMPSVFSFKAMCQINPLDWDSSLCMHLDSRVVGQLFKCNLYRQ